jgi:hypothetical protein
MIGVNDMENSMSIMERSLGMPGCYRMRSVRLSNGFRIIRLMDIAGAVI